MDYQTAVEKQKQYRKVPGLKCWFLFSRCAWQWDTQNHRRGEPLQKWGWRPSKDKGMGRFGGGWSWKLGILAGSSSFIIEFIVGSIRVTFKDPVKR